MNTPFSLQGKKILVVGASSGIGKSIAIECSKMGAELIISARSQEGLEATYSMLSGIGHQVIAADITKEEDRNRIIQNVASIDGLVMSVGIVQLLPLAFASSSKYEAMYNVNFFSQVEMIRILMKKKKIKQCTSIVIISSISGIRSIGSGNSIYGSAKAALDSYSKYAALEYAHRGIRVNTICPGMVNTGLIDQCRLADEEIQQDVAKYPLKRYGNPEDVAYAAIYLLSDAASWMTGHSLVLDGGISI